MTLFLKNDKNKSYVGRFISILWIGTMLLGMMIAIRSPYKYSSHCCRQFLVQHHHRKYGI